MTTSQQRRSGRHAVPSDDRAGAPDPVVPPQRAVSPAVPRQAVCANPSVRPSGQPLTVGEYAERLRDVVLDASPDVTGPQFGEWPYGRSAQLAAPSTGPDRTSGAGRGAFVFGALGLVVALLPLFALIPSVAALPVVGLPVTGLAAFPLAVIGLVLGVVGTDRAAGHRSVAVVGTLLATAGLALCVLWTTLIIVAALVSPASAGTVFTSLTS